MKTGIIRFNVTERGRKHRGVERNFDTAALANMVNSPEVQERVRKRDLHGYYGHGARSAFGMTPPEFAIVGGKQVTLEPALVTTMLKGMPDGTIEHESEFLDNPPGRSAKRLFSNKVGGFSSAISCREYAGKDVPTGFHGFDYVLEPNFSTNRGWALDSATHAGGMVLDDAIAESMTTLRVMDGLYNALQGDYDRMASNAARLAAENADLIAMLAGMSKEERDGMKQRLARLDSAGFETPTFRRLPSSPLQAMAREFEGMELAAFAAGPEAAEDRKLTSLVKNFTTRYLR